MSAEQHPKEAASFGRDGVVALALAFGTGATDAFAFLAFGGIFTANMTGNLILAGLFIRPQYLTTLSAGVLAIVVFAAAVAGAARYASHAAAARRGSRLLTVCAAAQTVVLVLWLLRPSGVDTRLAVTLIAMSLSAAAMGVQTVAARTLTLPSAATTTFVTGTIVSLVSDLATGRTAGWQFRTVEVVLLPAGAVAGTLMISSAASLGPVLPAAAAVFGALLTLRRSASRNR